MVQLIHRSELFNQNQALAYCLGSLQATYRENCLLESETEEEVESWLNHLNQVCDCEVFDEATQKFYVSELILHYSQKNIQEFAKKFAEEFTKLLREGGFQKIYFLLEIKTDWAESQISQKEVEFAYKKLQHYSQNQTYAEAFAVDLDSLTEFTEIIFWINHFADELPNIWFYSTEGSFLGNICPFANLHLHFYSKDAFRKIKNLLPQSKFKSLKAKEEKEQFE